MELIGTQWKTILYRERVLIYKLHLDTILLMLSHLRITRCDSKVQLSVRVKLIERQWKTILYRERVLSSELHLDTIL